MENPSHKIPFIPSVDNIIVVLFEIALLLLMAGSIYFYEVGLRWFRYVIYLMLILNIVAIGLFVNAKGTMTSGQEQLMILGISATVIAVVVVAVMVLTGAI
jgi:hypothetical protein